MTLHPALDKTFFYQTIDSTNLEAQRRRSEFSGSNILLVTKEQTAGQGQYDRAWDSRSGLGLWTSLFLGNSTYLEHDLQLLSLYTGIILQRVITKLTQVEVSLKWPNDIMIDSQKCAGILTKVQWMGSKATSAVIGIGINLKHQVTDFPEPIQDSATSLQMAGWSKPDSDELLKLLLQEFFQHLELMDNSTELISIWNSLAWKLNETVQFHSKDNSFKGEFLGISKEGKAKILVGDQIQQFSNGELRFGVSS